MERMKSSNTEWLGDIPTEWDVAQIGNYYELRNEKVSDYDFEPLSVTMKGIVPQLATAAKSDDHSNRKLVKKGDFVINSRSDRRGSCGISPLDGSVSLINIVMEPRGEMNPQYYNWLFHTEQFADEFYKWGHGIVDDLWTTRWQEMKKILIVAPSPDEQQAIADYLDETCSKIDEIIAEAKASINEYKELRQGVIFEAVTKGVNSNVELKNSGNEWIGMMPSNKRLTKVKYCGNFKKGPFGSAITKDMFVEKGANTFKVYEQKNAIYSDCTLGYYYISKDKYEELQGFAIQPRDIIVSCAGTIGKTYVLPDNCEPGIINQALMRIRLYDKIDRTYFSYLFESLLEYAGKKYSNGSAIKNIPPFAILNNLWIVDFDVNEQIEISEYLNIKLPQIDSLISEKESLINDLEVYKKSLIYEVVTGKRRVV